MQGEYLVTSKKTYKCVYVTKDNVEEFVKTYGAKAEHTFDYKNGWVNVCYLGMTWFVMFNQFYVEEESGEWIRYPKDEFYNNYLIEC